MLKNQRRWQHKSIKEQADDNLNYENMTTVNVNFFAIRKRINKYYATRF